jgi:hypothetical protein
MAFLGFEWAAAFIKERTAHANWIAAWEDTLARTERTIAVGGCRLPLLLAIAATVWPPDSTNS